ncbi:hypothetical protein ACJMK2_036596 [Sinanodonta woodiana]|uniref:Uncharacterized protein n=1 Tax=Sinanodonta woodiana TaxID=1069815 RepID=A0ABD3WHP8_SINWO
MIVTSLRLLLLIGSISTVFIPKQETDISDCCIIMQFLDVCQIPDRSRLLTTIKYMMAVFKAVNSHSKYALQVLCFPAHQQALFSLHTVNKSLYVKNVGSNKIMRTFSKQSRALAGMSNVAEQYDYDAGVIAFEEELIIKDLRDVHPFKRVFHKFEKTFAPTDDLYPSKIIKHGFSTIHLSLVMRQENKFLFLTQ